MGRWGGRDSPHVAKDGGPGSGPHPGLKELGYKKVKSSFGKHDTYTHPAAFHDKEHQNKVTGTLGKHGFEKVNESVLPAWRDKNSMISMHNTKSGKGHQIFHHEE